MRLKHALILSLMVATLAGCATKPATPDVWCSTNSPRTPTRAQYALYTRADKVDMDTHNTFGAEHCGWTPK